jgi:hypothetical protein
VVVGRERIAIASVPARFSTWEGYAGRKRRNGAGSRTTDARSPSAFLV